jgi:hypothetical protein
VDTRTSISQPPTHTSSTGIAHSPTPRTQTDHIQDILSHCSYPQHHIRVRLERSDSKQSLERLREDLARRQYQLCSDTYPLHSQYVFKNLTYRFYCANRSLTTLARFEEAIVRPTHSTLCRPPILRSSPRQLSIFYSLCLRPPTHAALITLPIVASCSYRHGKETCQE